MSDDTAKGEGRVIGLGHLFHPVPSFDEGWRFWNDIVGATAMDRWGEGESEAGFLGMGDTHAVVSGEPVGHSEETGMTSRHGDVQVFLLCENLDALHARMKSRGAKIVRAPFTTHWGQRCFTAEAPGGWVVGFTEKA